MAELAALQTLAPFASDTEPATTATQWKKLVDRFENLMEAMNITDAKRMKALLLHLAGEQTYDVYEGLVVQAMVEDADPAVDNVYLATKRALDRQFSPKKNVEFEIYNFRLVKQRAGKTINDYHEWLQALPK